MSTTPLEPQNVYCLTTATDSERQYISRRLDG